MAAARVLVVEDNAPLAENLAEILEDSGYVVKVVGSAEEAEALLGNESFDGVITDLRLPGKSGAELIERMRAQGIAAPVLVVTAYADPAAVERAEGAGALEVLPKPFDFERLFRITSAFERKEEHVLVLEDSRDLAENLAEALKSHGLEPIVAATVEGALAQHHLPKVAILDLRLPDGSGLEAMRRLRARDPSIRVLLVTGHVEDLSAEELEREPCIEKPVLEKPVSLAVLLDRVAVAAGRCPEPKH